jgi:cytochrome c peroxidase
VPADNPITNAKVRLGRRLFYDTRLSGNGTFSCASCHQQARAFSDGRARAVGSTGQAHARSAMSLTNVAYNASYGWADGRVRTLEGQMAVPMFNEHPIEMGLKGHEGQIVARFAGDPADAALFRESFPGVADPVSLDTIVKAIASFERTLVSAGSPFDRYLYRDERDALAPDAVRGMQLFFSDRLRCAQCHSGFNLSGPTRHAGDDRGPARHGRPQSDVAGPTFHNTGLYNVDGRGAYPAIDRGVFDVTHRPMDMGKFRAPTLRNVAVTAPYMHDGSVATLEAAIAHYASGGLASPFKSPRIRRFTMSAEETKDLVAFLTSLTDRDFLTNPELAKP